MCRAEDVGGEAIAAVRGAGIWDGRQEWGMRSRMPGHARELQIAHLLGGLALVWAELLFLRCLLCVALIVFGCVALLCVECFAWCYFERIALRCFA